MKEPKKICISRLDRIGDLIMTTPAIISIRQNWPGSKITLLASEVNSKVLNYSPLIDEIIEIDSKKKLIEGYFFKHVLKCHFEKNTRFETFF